MSYIYSEMFTRHKKPPTYKTPAEFFDAAANYFMWCEDHPIQEEKVFQHNGQIVRGDSDKVRAFTKQGLAAYLGIPYTRLEIYRGRQGRWAEVMELVDNVIYTQKFENAAAGLLNAGLIARDLGIAEKNELSGPGGGAIQTEDLTERDAELFTRGIARLAAAVGERSGVESAAPEDTSGA